MYVSLEIYVKNAFFFAHFLSFQKVSLSHSPTYSGYIVLWNMVRISKYEWGVSLCHFKTCYFFSVNIIIYIN